MLKVLPLRHKMTCDPVDLPSVRPANWNALGIILWLPSAWMLDTTTFNLLLLISNVVRVIAVIASPIATVRVTRQKDREKEQRSRQGLTICCFVISKRQIPLTRTYQVAAQMNVMFERHRVVFWLAKRIKCRYRTTDYPSTWASSRPSAKNGQLSGIRIR